MSSTTEATRVLDTLREDTTSWTRLISYSPEDPSASDSDEHLRARYLALLALHAQNHPTPIPTDEALIAYILDEETLYHQTADYYRSALSLAAYLLARFRTPRYLWAIWAARESNYDASKSVDVHLMYYAAGGIDAAKTYVEGCDKADIVTGVREGGARVGWWQWYVDKQNGGNEDKAVEAVKKEVVARIAQDKQFGVTEEKVTEFVEGSWRTDTHRWEESLLDD